MIDAKALGEAILAATFPTTIAKTETLNIAMADLPLNSIMELLRYGTGRKFNDAVGGADKDAATKVTMAKAMLAEYKEGTIAKRREGSAAVDPRVQLARTLMFEAIKGKLSKEQKVKIKAMEKADRDAWIDQMVERNRDMIDLAVEEEMKRRAKLPKVEIDIDL